MGDVVPLKTQFWDSFTNFLAGFGLFGRDKAMSQVAVLNILDRQQIEALYRGDWISRKIVDIPAFDATRAWRAWQAEEDQIEALEDAEREFGLQRKMLSALIKARLYGGAAIVLGVDQGSFQDELEVDRVKKGGLKFIHVVERWMIQAGPTVRDITSPWFGQPSYYFRSNTPTVPAPGNVEPPPSLAKQLGEKEASAFYIHPSRVVRLTGLDYPDLESAPDAWGDSVLQAPPPKAFGGGLARRTYLWMVCSCSDGLLPLLGK